MWELSRRKVNPNNTQCEINTEGKGTKNEKGRNPRQIHLPPITHKQNGGSLTQLKIQVINQAGSGQTNKKDTSLRIWDDNRDFTKQIICVVVLCISLIAIGVNFEIGITKPSSNNSQPGKVEPPAPAPPDQTVFNCNTNPTECYGLPSTVVDLINKNYSQPDQARAVIQTFNSLNLILANVNASRETLIQFYRNITRSATCMAYHIPDSTRVFQALVELHFVTEQQILLHLNVIEAFSGQPLRISGKSTAYSNCRFNLTSGGRRRLQQNQSPVGSANCAQTNSVLIYFNGIGSSPIAIIQNVWKIQEILANDSRTQFDGGVISVGAFRRDAALGYFLDIIQKYQLMLQSINQRPPSRMVLLSCLRMISNHDNSSSRLPAGISLSNFKKFRSILVKNSMQSFNDQQQQYQLSLHQQFIVHQINSGKKVVLLAHAEATSYANIVYNLLTSAQKLSVSLVYIAPTVPSMADGRTNYITNPSDYIISEMRTHASSNNSFPAPLPENVNPANFNSDLDLTFNHDPIGYVEAYKQTFLQLIADAKTRAVQPSALAGRGPLTATLRWDNQLDQDLYVYQPRNQVFFGNAVGFNGYLDVDDTTGYGPQHYYGNCTLFETGEYFVQVNFLSGNATSDIVVVVAAGAEYYMITRSLEISQTYTICRVIATLDSTTQSYQFTIET